MIKYLVFVGMIGAMIGEATYIKEMLKGKVKPNRVSWLMWSISPLIATFAAISTGVTLAVIPVFISGFCPLMVFTISLFKKEAYWKITKRDYVCGVLSLLALVLWYITKDPIVAIILSIVSDGLAAIPTVLKAWKYPKTESSIAFLGGIFNAATSFAAVEVWNFSSLAFPIYVIIVNIIIVLAIERKRILRSEEKKPI